MSKRTGVLAGGAVLLVAIVAAVVVWAVPILKVSSFEVEGNAHVTPEDVERASGVAKGSNLVRLDAHAAAGGVAQLSVGGIRHGVAGISVDGAHRGHRARGGGLRARR